jgi:hypothetical protein
VYCWLWRRKDRAAWAVTLVPPATVLAWQLFERFSTGALPASVLAGYFQTYGFQAAGEKLRNAGALAVHACFLVFPVLLPPAILAAWRKRDRDTVFLAAWIGIFFAGAVAVFFAGSARYLLPMAAPVALLVSRLRRKWLAAGFAAQMALSLGLAAANYQHWDGYRRFAESLRAQAGPRRVWINGEWGLRYYLESDGGLALRKARMMYPGEVVVTSELAYPVTFTNPVAPLAQAEIRPSIPLRLIGLDSRSGYSTVSKGFLPFGISTGPVDRVRAELVVERKPVLEYLPMTASEQMVTGLMAQAPALGVCRVSLNFAVFRSVFARGERLGAGPVLRLWRSLLLAASRFWQIESLYRANAKFQPVWTPRFICFRSSADLPRVSVAALRAEAFLVAPAWLKRLLPS